MPERPRVLAILPGLFPSTLTLAVKPLLALHNAGSITADITLEVVATRRQVSRADLVVFCRNLEPAYDFLLEAARSLGKPIVYNLDDDFFDVPLTTEEGRYYRDPARLGQLERYLAQASLVRVYSRALKEKAGAYNQNVQQLSSPLYWPAKAAPPPAAAAPTARIVYTTSRIYDGLASVFLGSALRILERYRHAELHFWGYQPPELRNHPRVRLVKLVTDYDRYLRRFCEQGYDIGLAPLLNDEFHRGKTNTKFREYGACRVAGIYSDVEVYADCVKPGDTGLLVNNEPEAWYEAMARLIEDAGLRNQIRDGAERYVRQHYSPEAFEQLWWQHIQQVLPGAGAHVAIRTMDVGRLASTSRQPSGSGQQTNAGPDRAPVVRLALQAWGLIERLRRRGWAATWHTLGWYWNNVWALARIRAMTRRWRVV
jgi:glycosyltransferase involved in cell wall biosynthesis